MRKIIVSSKSKSTQNNPSIKEFIASLDDEQSVTDCHVLLEMMQRADKRA